MLIETLETGDPYEIHGAHFQTTNGIACMGAAPRRVYNAFNKCDFIMSVDLFMTPTIMALADLVMPAATFPERNGIRVGDGPQRGEIINKVTQIGECKSDMEINLELGKRLNPEAWPWETVEEMLSELLKPTGYTFEELREDAPVYLPVEYYKYKTGKMRKDGQPGFQTATGRIELWSTFYNAAELDPLPYFEEPEPGPTSTPELFEKYPLVLTTGARRWSYFHPSIVRWSVCARCIPTPRCRCIPTCSSSLTWWTANGCGSRTRTAARRSRSKRRPSCPTPRIVACDHAWWRPEGDPEKFFDVFEYNINNLMIYDPGKSGFGSNYKTSICRLYKLEDGE